MGLCGSKPQNHLNGDSSIKEKVDFSQRKTNNGSELHTVTNNEKLSPREAARKAAEEREAKLALENSKSELSKRLAKERAKSRTAYIKEIGR